MQGFPGVTTADAREYGVRCAYCEGAIHHAGHIEHFRRKDQNHFPELTFAWGNLFLACGSTKHCGHYKDCDSTPSYNPDELIKPDEHDPDDWLYFHSSGKVRVKSGVVAANDLRRAEETIRVFNLNSPTLVGARANVTRAYKERVLRDLDEIASWNEEEREAFLRGEVAATRWEPHATAIKHFLQSQS